MIRRILLFAALACTPPNTLRSEHVLTGASRPAAWSGEVKVVMDGAPLPREFDEVAIVNASGSAAQATLPDIIGALQNEARGLGCNAVIRVRYDRGSGTASATGVAVWIK